MNLQNLSHRSLPKNRMIRISLGLLFILGGIFGWLPVLGFWMIPLGLLFLSIDFAIARRWRRKLVVWWEKRRRRQKSKEHDG